jgi:hypothetical protein
MAGRAEPAGCPRLSSRAGHLGQRRRSIGGSPVAKTTIDQAQQADAPPVAGPESPCSRRVAVRRVAQAGPIAGPLGFRRMRPAIRDRATPRSTMSHRSSGHTRRRRAYGQLHALAITCIWQRTRPYADGRLMPDPAPSKRSTSSVPGRKSAGTPLSRRKAISRSHTSRRRLPSVSGPKSCRALAGSARAKLSASSAAVLRSSQAKRYGDSASPSYTRPGACGGRAAPNYSALSVPISSTASDLPSRSRTGVKSQVGVSGKRSRLGLPP